MTTAASAARIWREHEIRHVGSWTGGGDMSDWRSEMGENGYDQPLSRPTQSTRRFPSEVSPKFPRQ